MAPSKLAIPLIFLALIFSQIRAQKQEIRVPSGYLPRKPSPEPKIRAKAVVHEKNTPIKNGFSLESEITKINKLIKEKEKVIQQNSEGISSLRSEIESLQKNGPLVEQQVGKAHARADELEKKVNELGKELQLQRNEKEKKDRVNEVVKKIDDLLSKIENVQGTVNELTRPLVTKEMEWFAASALLALLIIILFRIFSTFVYKH